MSPRPINLIVMRRDTKAMIDEDKWAIVRYREGKHADSPEETASFTGRIVGNTERGFLEVNPIGMRGETGLGRYRWALLAEWDVTGGINGGDELRCTHTASGRQMVLRVITGQGFPHKWEAMCDELQP